MSESLGPLSNGVNYVNQAIKIAAGRKKVNINHLKPKFFRLFLISKNYLFTKELEKYLVLIS